MFPNEELIRFTIDLAKEALRSEKTCVSKFGGDDTADFIDSVYRKLKELNEAR